MEVTSRSKLEWNIPGKEYWSIKIPTFCYSNIRSHVELYGTKKIVCHVQLAPKFGSHEKLFYFDLSCLLLSECKMIQIIICIFNYYVINFTSMANAEINVSDMTLMWNCHVTSIWATLHPTRKKKGCTTSRMGLRQVP